jgi:hypothetical protein
MQAQERKQRSEASFPLLAAVLFFLLVIDVVAHVTESSGIMDPNTSYLISEGIRV